MTHLWKLRFRDFEGKGDVSVVNRHYSIFILWICEVLFEPVHTLLTPAASRSMEFTDVLENFTQFV